MLLSKVVDGFKEGNVTEKVELIYCKDVNKTMDTFLYELQHHGVRRLSVGTDFLVSASDEKVQKFFKTLGSIPRLEELKIESVSRFHALSVSQNVLLTLRLAKHLKGIELLDFQPSSTNLDFLNGLGAALHQHPSLEQFKLRNLIPADRMVDSTGSLDILMKNVATVPNLEVLEVSGSFCLDDVQRETNYVSAPIVSKVARMPSLSTLHLDFLNLQDIHYEAVAESLESPQSSLQCLSMSHNNVETVGIIRLLNALSTNQNLTCVSINTFVPLSAEVADEFANMLSKNYTLQKLSADLPFAHQKKVELYLRWNSLGRCRLRDHYFSVEDWLDILASSNHDVDLTRLIVMAKPEFCIQ